MHLLAAMNTKVENVGHGDSPTHRADTHFPAGIEGVRTHVSTSLFLRMSAGVLCRE